MSLSHSNQSVLCRGGGMTGGGMTGGWLAQAGHAWYKSVFDGPSISEDVRRWCGNPATRGDSEHYYLQVGFDFARALWTGMADGRKHLPLIPKVAFLNPAIESCFWYFGFKPIPNLNPYLNHSELMPKLNTNLNNVKLMPKLNLKHFDNS